MARWLSPGRIALLAVGIALAVVGSWFVEHFVQVINGDRCTDVQAWIADYRESHGSYPPDLSVFGWWRPRDMWGRRLFYERRGDGYILVSLGRDGKPDGSDYWELRRQLSESGHHNGVHLENHEWDICGDFDRDVVLTDVGRIQICGL